MVSFVFPANRSCKTKVQFYRELALGPASGFDPGLKPEWIALVIAADSLAAFHSACNRRSDCDRRQYPNGCDDAAAGRAFGRVHLRLWESILLEPTYAVSATPQEKSRALRAPQMTLLELGHAGAGGELTVQSSIPVAHGYGAPTADVIAASINLKRRRCQGQGEDHRDDIWNIRHGGNTLGRCSLGSPDACSGRRSN